MSHAIRTPMNVIMGFTNIALQHADDSDKMKECLEKIRVSGSNLQELIDDVLDISRIESEEFKIVSQPVKLPELFDFYCQAIAGMAEAKNIRFSGKLHDISHNVLLSDQIRLGQIYMNLLSNAVKYTPSGGHIRLAACEGEKNTVRITVQDDGIGIPAEDVPRLFERFYRVDKARSRAAGGTGLGLSIATEIVQRHHGSLTLVDRPGPGTTVRLELPITQPAPGAPEDTAENTSAQQ